MSEPNFSFLSLPDFLLVELEKRITSLQNGLLLHRDPSLLILSLQRLEKIRGNFAFDLISSIACASRTLCKKASEEKRLLNALEMHSLSHAFKSMDRARRAAVLATAA